MNPYHLTQPLNEKVPLVVSVPHSGTRFPTELVEDYHPHVIDHPVDTDWFVDQLYRFVTQMGITLVVAPFSRYVIDLNRNPDNQPLYSSTRTQTALVPIKSFDQKDLYQKNNPEPREIQRRIKKYHTPYYQCLATQLEDLKSTFGHALLFDAHSIKHRVPSIQKDPFSQLTLSDNQGQTAHQRIAETALQELQKGPYTVAYNKVFLGGHLTRNFGKPEKKIYSLQLEMCQNIYMDEERNQYLPEKAKKVQKLLKSLFSHLIQTMEELRQ